jgi:hypothetical protein
MRIDESYQGPVRIVGKVGNTRPYMIEVSDIASGEQLDGVFRAVVELDANTDRNIVTLSYYETDERGLIVSNDGKEPKAFTVTIEHPFVDVSANVTQVEKAEKNGKPGNV